MNSSLKNIAQQYFDRFQDLSMPLTFQWQSNLRTIIVIPCYKEPEILATLESLANCDTPKYETLVLVLINASESASDDIKTFNEESFQQVKQFCQENKLKNLQFECIIHQNMPEKQAGVGYARKILMDTALQIFSSINQDGIIVNTDADCLFSKNYITRIENAFNDPKLGLAILHYEHRLTGLNDNKIYDGIIQYELHLRYYKQALQWAGYPNVLETIGSCMVCTASVYALEGGMNKRKAGEDFYFINKLAKNNKSKTIYEATVFPSSRTSDRVPFGTGKAMEVYTQNTENEYFTYAFDCFIALQNFLNQLPLLYTNGFEYIIIDTHTKAFLEREKIEENVAKMHQQSKDFERFKLRFFYWFDGLKALQLIHYLTEKKYAKVTVTKASLVFLEKINHLASFNNTLTILNYYRSLEKNEYICQ